MVIPIQPIADEPAPPPEPTPPDPTGPETPVLTAQLMQSVVAVVIAVIIAFKPGSITNDQRNALEAAVFVFWGLAMALYQQLKGQVRSIPAVVRIKNAAYELGVTASPATTAAHAMGAPALATPTLEQVERRAEGHLRSGRPGA